MSEVPLSGRHGHCFEALEPRLGLQPLEGLPSLSEQRLRFLASTCLCKPFAVLEQHDCQPEARADLTQKRHAALEPGLDRGSLSAGGGQPGTEAGHLSLEKWHPIDGR